MPMACEPVELAGLNRMWRQLAINGIEADPAWQNGEYKSQPMMGLRAAQNLLFVAGGAPLFLQAQYPTRAAASAYAEERVSNALKSLDADDLIYQLDSSRNYNPWPNLERIKVPLTWINSADDFINPRNFTFSADALKRMPTAKFRLIPESTDTHGHGTHTWAKFWKADLISLLARSNRE
jgi:homoserine O-acetyltransferase